jgi:hypothetical protein
MPLSPDERNKVCLSCYGLNAANWDAYKASAMEAGFGLPGAGRRAAMSILSDVQEMLAMGMAAHEPGQDTIRQMINRAKALMLEEDR